LIVPIAGAGLGGLGDCVPYLISATFFLQTGRR